MNYFTDEDFQVLIELLAHFDQAFPDIQIHLDAFFYRLSDLVSRDGANESFEQFRTRAMKARSLRGDIPIPSQTTLSFMTLGVAAGLSRAMRRFPEIETQSDRVFYEIGKKLSPQYFPHSFEHYRERCILCRAAVNSKTKGAG